MYYNCILKVRLDSTLEESEPGGNIQLNIETKPNSYVGVLGIDQSVQLLKTGNDIDEVVFLLLFKEFFFLYVCLWRTFFNDHCRKK